LLDLVPAEDPFQEVLQIMIRQSIVFLTLLAVAVFTSGKVRSAESDATKAATKAFHQLIDNEWQWTLHDDPEFASWLGDHRHDQRWQNLSLDAIERRHEYRQSVLEHLAKIDSLLLSKQDRVSYELFRGQYQNAVDAYQFGWHLVPLTQRGGIQDTSSLASSLRFETVKDYEAWNIRLYSFPEYMDQTLALMQEGVDRKIVHARVVMTRLPAQIRRQIVDDPTKSLFYKPYRDMPDSISVEKQVDLKEGAELSIRTRIVPAYRKMLRFFEEVYLPACFEKVGVWQIPNGREFYASRARQFTTTDLTPQQIHDIGHHEVKRIRREMKDVMREVGFNGTFAEFLEHLRTDQKYYYKDPNKLLSEYKAICRRIDPQLPKMFGRLPRRPYQLEAIPQHLAPDTTTAYYRSPSADGSRNGTYFVNLYRPETRPTYEMEVLSVHEAVPGHHLQIAVAQELEGIPEFRRYGGYTAFIEGWGLYSEKLGYELGLYKDPYSRFGQLTYDMWRAVRLVVDTGIHDQGWSRQKAIDFFAANAAKSMHDIENEIDRYIAWPGQALAYKIGQLRILELRKKAETELGDKFDLRAFHDTILGQGAVTLNVLDGIVNDWIAERKVKD
jgi:prolyl oligopeptidase